MKKGKYIINSQEERNEIMKVIETLPLNSMIATDLLKLVIAYDSKKRKKK